MQQIMTTGLAPVRSCLAIAGRVPGDKPAQPTSVMLTQSGEAAATPRRLRVVIVEDEAIIAMDLELLLEDLNADVMGTAITAAGACALVAQHKPDFVTMDINIKGDRDGISAAQLIYDTYGVRSIFVTSYSDAATKERAAPCHAIAWIKKPIMTADLTKAVALVKRRAD